MKKLLCLLLCVALAAMIAPAALALEESDEWEGYAAAGAYEGDGVATFALDGASNADKLSDLSRFEHDKQYASHTLQKGIDVSAFQGSVDWASVKRDGVDFAVVRVGGRYAGSGNFYSDSRMEQNLQGAIGQGIAAGAYFFSQAITEQEAREEAAEAIRLLGDWARLLKLPIYIDMEYFQTAGRLYDAQLSAAEHTKIALAFCKAIEDAGYEAGVYVGLCTFPINANDIVSAGYEIWHAQWNSRATVSPVYTMWQFSSTGSVSGILGSVDLNFRYIAASQSGTGSTGSSTNVSFSDVSSSSWYYSSVNYVVKNGLFNGVGDGRFEPKETMDREMFVTVLYRLAGSPSVSGASEFSDVAKSSLWYYAPVLWATQNGIVEGMGDGTFGVGEALTRQDMVTLLARYAKYAGLDTTSEQSLSDFPDASGVNSWARASMSWAVENGIVTGTTESADDTPKLMPQSTCERAQAAAVIERFAKLLAESETE